MLIMISLFQCFHKSFLELSGDFSLPTNSVCPFPSSTKQLNPSLHSSKNCAKRNNKRVKVKRETRFTFHVLQAHKYIPKAGSMRLRQKKVLFHFGLKISTVRTHSLKSGELIVEKIFKPENYSFSFVISRILDYGN
jgi:hypothetical protein